ncbi:MAG TPA: acyl-CoA dehydratase activase [Terriglobia bacterium]|nr:acyl-CoA dehydratase activase [Terriglobia bacterium]
MSINIGLDIGAVSLKLAAIGGTDDGPGFRTLAEKSSTFYAASFPDSSPFASRALVLSRYRRLQGSPIQSTFDLLKELYDYLPEEDVEGIRVTGSGSQLIAKVLGIYFENEFRAIAKGLRTFYPQVRTVFEMGGEASKYLRLDPNVTGKHLGIVDYQTSGECAAGTGSFIDQQATRLLYSIEEVGPAACGASCAARIAGRCSVFAKTDMIHAQQKGYTTEQILRGLCDAVARNYKSSLVKGRAVVPPVAFIGGVAMNQGVRNALREAFKLKEADLLIPDHYAWLGAMGAAMLEAEEYRKRSFKRIHQLRQHEAARKNFACTEPLSMENVLLLRDRTAEVWRGSQEPGVRSQEYGARGQEGVVSILSPDSCLLTPPSRIEAYLGIDIGSVSTNLVVIDAVGNLLKEIYLRTQGRPIEVVDRGLKEIEAELATSLDIRGVGTTGSGRELIGELVGADTVNDEITAHKTGSMHVCNQMGMDPVDTIFEIGGQDSKFIRIDKGVVVDFTMNEACAAGTGSFLEEQAEKLGIAIKEEFAELALASASPARLGERCTVFMERDVTGLMHKGAEVGDLAAGLAYSVALNYLNRVVRGRKIGKVIFFQGGTAYNDAVAAAFSQILGKPIIVPPHNGVIGAIGMALIARDRMKDAGHPSRFRGYDLGRVNFTTREFVCQACSNFCDMKEFNIEGQRTYWGDKCSDKFRKRARTDRQPVIEDLIEWREKLLEEVLLPTRGGSRTVGIPRTMFYYDRFPFWCAYFQELGFDVVLSSPTDRKISMAGEELTIAQPCFPVKVAHGHVQDLLEKGTDYVLLPNVVNVEAPESQVDSFLCPWNQTLPFVIRAAPQLEHAQAKYLSPTVHFRLGRKHVEKQLAEFARTLGIKPRTNAEAVRAAYAAQEAFTDTLLEAGAQALAKLQETCEPALVLVGRPYNLYDRSVNCDIPRKLRALYGVNVLPMEVLPLDDEDITDINPNMYWSSGRRILAAARLTQRYRHLHLVYISNFKCGPDSYIKSFIDEAAGKPSLVLQFDGHANDAGFITRCEAYLDSKGFLRCPSSATAMSAAT